MKASRASVFDARTESCHKMSWSSVQCRSCRSQHRRQANGLHSPPSRRTRTTSRYPKTNTPVWHPGPAAVGQLQRKLWRLSATLATSAAGNLVIRNAPLRRVCELTLSCACVFVEQAYPTTVHEATTQLYSSWNPSSGTGLGASRRVNLASLSVPPPKAKRRTLEPETERRRECRRNHPRQTGSNTLNPSAHTSITSLHNHLQNPP